MSSPFDSRISARTVYPFPTLSHDQLLSLARKTVEAARNHDFDHVEANALQLFEAFSDHVQAERPVFLQHLRSGDARLIRHAQQQIEDLLLKLAASAAQKADGCSCENLADDVVARLALQAADEGRQLLAVAD